MINPTVLIFANNDSQHGNVFTLNDPVRGTLNNGGTYPLGGDLPIDFTDESQTINIERGRRREFDQMTPGSCSVMWPNDQRQFDELYSGSPLYGIELTGKKMQVLLDSQAVFTGWIESVSYSYNRPGISTVSIQAIDSLGQLGRREFDDWTATPGKAGARLTEVLNRGDVRFGANRVLDTGVSDLQGDTVSWGSNVLNYLQLIALSDFGRLFADRKDQLTFKDRHAVLNQPSEASFTGDDTGILYAAISRASSLDMTFNRVSVDRAGGTKQTSLNESSIDTRGVRSLSLSGVLLASDAISLSFADYLVNLYGTPRVRINALSVDLDSLTAASLGVVTALDIASVVEATFTPDNLGVAIEQQLIIEGMTWSLAAGRVNMVQLSFSTSDARRFFTLNDPTLGRLNSGNVLAL